MCVCAHAGGQAKRCNIGIALLADPRIIFLDEPTSGLDSYTSHEARARRPLHGLRPHIVPPSPFSCLLLPLPLKGSKQHHPLMPNS